MSCQRNDQLMCEYESSIVKKEMIISNRKICSRIETSKKKLKRNEKANSIVIFVRNLNVYVHFSVFNLTFEMLVWGVTFMLKMCVTITESQTCRFAYLCLLTCVCSLLNDTSPMTLLGASGCNIKYFCSCYCHFNPFNLSRIHQNRMI